MQKFSSWKEQSHKNLFPDNKSTKNVEDDYDSLFRTALQKVRSSVPAHIKIIIFYHPSSIVRADDFFKQLPCLNAIKWANISTGIQVFAVGLFKKMVLADHLGVFVDDVFYAPVAYDSLTVLW